MKRRPLLSFFIMTFAITWGLAALYFIFPNFFTSLLGPVSVYNPLFVLAVWAPTISKLELLGVLLASTLFCVLHDLSLLPDCLSACPWNRGRSKDHDGPLHPAHGGGAAGCVETEQPLGGI